MPLLSRLPADRSRGGRRLLYVLKAETANALFWATAAASTGVMVLGFAVRVVVGGSVIRAVGVELRVDE